MDRLRFDEDMKNTRGSVRTGFYHERTFSMKSIYTCPHCGEKSFNPITKAFAGGLHTRGKACKNCGHHCVNGTPSMIFSAVVYIAALIMVLYIYFKGNSIWGLACVAVAYVLCRLFDAFIAPLVKPIRNDVLNS